MRGFFLIIFIAFYFVGHPQQDSLSFTFPEPLNLDSLKSKKIWGTQYYIHQFNSGGSIPMLDKNRNQTGFFADTCDFCTASLEGTAYVIDSSGAITVLNYDGVSDTSVVDCRKCNKYKNSKLKVESWGKVLWRKTDGFGDGVLNYRLIPFRTIAVDPVYIPYGSVLYIPLARGIEIQLPDGKKVKHDGYFFAGDTGGAIKKNHLDFFTGIYEGNPFTKIIYSNPAYEIKSYLVTDTVIVQNLTKEHQR